MAGESLQQYKQKQPQVSYINSTVSANRNNKAYRTAYNRSHMPGFSASIFPNGSKLTFQGSSYDPILANNSVLPSTGSSSGTNVLNTLTNVFTVATGALGLAAVVGQTVNLFKSNKSDDKSDDGFTKKESKEIARNTENVNDTVTAIDTCLDTAKGMDETSSQSDLQTMATNLQDLATIAGKQKAEAERNIESAKRSLEILNPQLTSINTKKGSLLSQKANKSKLLEDLKNGDTLNRPEQYKNLSDVQVKNLISQLEKEIALLDKDIKKCDDEFDKIKCQISVKQKIIEDNTQTKKLMAAKESTARAEQKRIDGYVQK